MWCRFDVGKYCKKWTHQNLKEHGEGVGVVGDFGGLATEVEKFGCSKWNVGEYAEATGNLMDLSCGPSRCISDGSKDHKEKSGGQLSGYTLRNELWGVSKENCPLVDCGMFRLKKAIAAGKKRCTSCFSIWRTTSRVG